MKKHKNYELDEIPNEWGYYEAVSLIDCDAYILRDKTLEGLKIQIDEYIYSLKKH